MESTKETVLVTGGAGFIGSHTCVELLNAGYSIVSIDNLYNASIDAYDSIESITGKKVKHYECDLLNEGELEEVFKNNNIDAVIHFAGLKAVGESVIKPLEYYNNNLTGTINLLKVMRRNNVKKIVFSSSATVYGMTNDVPFNEDMPTSATNPYGQTKVMIEQILKDVSVAYPDWKIVLLRYFNPIGAHSSGLLGENPKGVPNNLMPYICKVAIKELPILNVFGNDYPTRDGTGIRDYIHVVDLALGHVKALDKLDTLKSIGIYNLGTGHGYSVLEIVSAFEKANSIKIPYKIQPRRPGDIAECYANVEKAKEELEWTATHSLEEMCRDSWNYIKKSIEKN